MREELLPRELLYIADEAFFVGTAVEITPIRSVDKIVVGKGRRGPVTEALQAAFFDIINGVRPDTHGWLTYVSPSAPKRSDCSRRMHLNDLLKIAAASGASDLHLKVGSYPMMRVNGTLVVASEEKRLDRHDTEAMASVLFTPEHQEKFRRQQEVDLAYSVTGLGRFRCNVFQQRGTVGMVLRVIPTRVRTIDELGLPPVLKRIAEEERGLVLVTGTTGSGKSTTLAAMIDHVNSTRAAHIMTVEDPIEYLHRDYQSIVSQREVAVDTASFSQALRSALRQDPDVILVGEMRDFETVETALLAAETGHLVFSTLHTLDATETISRIISVFPPHQQRQIRIQLSTVLKAAVSQRLMPRADGLGRVPAVEVMIATPFIRDCIVDKDRTSHIHGAIASGTSQYGMQTFDQSIFGLYQQGFVTLDEAMRWASNLDEFKLKVQGISTTAEMARDEMAKSGRRPAGHHPVWRLTPGAPPTSTRSISCPGARCRSPNAASACWRVSTPPTRSTRRSPISSTPAASTTSVWRWHTRAPRSRSRAVDASASCASSRRGGSTKTWRPKQSPTSSARKTSGRSSPGHCRRSCADAAKRPADAAEQARLYQYLMRQGFTPAVVIEALRKLRRAN